MAQAASMALPPRSNIFAPAVAACGLPVIATQCRPWSTGFCVEEKGSGPAAGANALTTKSKAKARSLIAPVSVTAQDCLAIIRAGVFPQIGLATYAAFASTFAGARKDARINSPTATQMQLSATLKAGHG